jgi:catechol 2,3-dioxygenase-like lactoylglutathione lyase family enzyme
MKGSDVTAVRVRPGVNHVALFATDLDRSVGFYKEVFGYSEPIDRCENVPMRGEQASLRAPGSESHHDLAITGIGERYDEIRARVGATLSHFALEVDTIEDLVVVRDTLKRLGQLDGEFDTGATKSVFGLDPDGNRFEVM